MSELLEDPILASVPVIDGFKVLDPCILVSKLGQGGMGAVYRGQHVNLDVEVAVKCLLASLASQNPEFVIRFQREAKVAAAINDPHLIRVYDVAQRHDVHYLVMEFVEGENARERVARKGALSIEEAVTITLGAARGLAAAHRQGVVHRDIKPDNILIGQDGSVKVADLGLAKAADALDSLATSTHVVMGTPQYMPPEQFEGAALVGPPGDVYALGATFYFMLSGKNAIERGSLTEVMKRVVVDPFPDISLVRGDLPPALVELIRTATAKDVFDRYADCGEFATVLERCLGTLASTKSLVDPKAGKGTTRSALVSPPPPRTLARVQQALTSGSLAKRTPVQRSEEYEAAGPTQTSAQPPRGQQIVSVIDAAPAKRRGVAALIMGLLVLLGAGAAGFVFRDRLMGLVGGSGSGDGGDGATKIETEPEVEPKTGPPTDQPDLGKRSPEQRLEAALADIRGRETLTRGVDELRTLHTEWPKDEKITSSFGAALRRQAELRRDAGDLGGAYEIVLEAQAIADDEPTRALRTRVAEAIRGVLAANLTWETPGEDDVSDGSVVVRGTIAEAERTTVRVRGREVAVVGGLFETRLDALGEGRHPITLTIEESHGVVYESVRQVVVDTLPPNLAIVAPSADSWQRETVEVRGTVQDGTSVRVDVEGRPATVARGSWTVTDRWPDGEHEVLVTATDEAGRQSTARVAFRVDTAPPMIEVTSPVDGAATSATRITVRGRVSDGGELTAVLVQDRDATVAADGRFEVVLELARDGAAEIVVQARDAAGNEASRAIRVLRDLSAPIVSVDWPGDGAELEPGSVDVRGRVSEGAQTTVTVNGVTAAVNGDAWSARITLPAGSQTIQVVARDRAGNQSPPVTRRVSVVSARDRAAQLLRSGMAKLDAGQARAAITDFDQAIRYDATNEIAFNLRGSAYFVLNDAPRAIEDFSSAIRLDARFAKAYANRGDASALRGDDGAAVTDYEQAVQIDPNLAVAHYGWGEVHLRRREWAAAYERQSRAIAAAPRYAVAWASRGWAAFQLESEGPQRTLPLRDFFRRVSTGDPYRQSLDDLTKAIEIDPQLAIAYAYRGHVKVTRDDKKSGARDKQRAYDLGWRD